MSGVDATRSARSWGAASSMTFPPLDARADPGDRCRRIEREFGHAPGIDEHRAIRGDRRTVTRRLHRDRQVSRCREPHRGRHILRTGRHHDHRRVMLNGSVPPSSLGVVPLIARLQHLTLHKRLQFQRLHVTRAPLVAKKRLGWIEVLGTGVTAAHQRRSGDGGRGAAGPENLPPVETGRGIGSRSAHGIPLSIVAIAEDAATGFQLHEVATESSRLRIARLHAAWCRSPTLTD